MTCSRRQSPIKCTYARTHARMTLSSTTLLLLPSFDWVPHDVLREVIFRKYLVAIEWVVMQYVCRRFRAAALGVGLGLLVRRDVCQQVALSAARTSQTQLFDWLVRTRAAPPRSETNYWDLMWRTAAGHNRAIPLDWLRRRNYPHHGLPGLLTAAIRGDCTRSLQWLWTHGCIGNSLFNIAVIQQVVDADADRVLDWMLKERPLCLQEMNFNVNLMVSRAVEVDSVDVLRLLISVWQLVAISEERNYRLLKIATDHRSRNTIRYLASRSSSSSPQRQKCFDHACNTIADVDFLVWMHGLGFAWSSQAVQNLAVQVNLEALQLVHSMGTPLPPHCCDVLIRMHTINGVLLPANTNFAGGLNANDAANVAKRRHVLETLRWLRERGVPWDETQERLVRKYERDNHLDPIP